MNEAVIVAIIAAAGTLGGVIVKVWSDYRATESAEEMDDRNRLRVYQDKELSYCRQELNKWRSLALKNLGGMEEAAEVLEQQNTGGPS